MLVLKLLVDQYDKVLDSKDKRFAHLPFQSPLSITVLVTLYLYFVLKAGPKFMATRNAFKIDNFLLFYNILQVVLNFTVLAFSIHEILDFTERKINWLCEELDFTNSFIGRRSAQMSYCYLLLKILDLMDTIFFVLRKKFNQVSFLHVYHHVAILIGAYIAVGWAPGGHPWMFGLLNCFVHVLMYAYYFGSVYNEQLKKMIWLKKSLTKIQIIQFVLSILHLSIPLFFGNCGYPTGLLILGITQNFIMLVLFSDFYYKAYVKKSREVKLN